ncbi:MAG TPA: hypothetical protein VKB27_14115 [Gammaproteobacteria bacterium]|nr:hypothetical protein [Gammaproteobacteria bacterium]
MTVSLIFADSSEVIEGCDFKRPQVPGHSRVTASRQLRLASCEARGNLLDAKRLEILIRFATMSGKARGSTDIRKRGTNLYFVWSRAGYGSVLKDFWQLKDGLVEDIGKHQARVSFLRLFGPG